MSDIRNTAQQAVALGAKTEIVGSWVWCSFDHKPDQSVRDSLKQLGFHWNHKRSVWQLAGRRSFGSKEDSIIIRAKYGVEELTKSHREERLEGYDSSSSR